MIKKQFRVEMDLEVTIHDDPPEHGHPYHNDLVTINLFFQQFATNPLAMLLFFKSYFIDCFFVLESQWLETLKDLLGYEDDFKPLFLAEAEKCPQKVRELIKQIYEELDPSSPLVDWQEKLRDLLESQFGPMVITAAKFDYNDKDPESIQVTKKGNRTDLKILNGTGVS